MPLQQLEAPRSKGLGDMLRVNVPLNKDAKCFTLRVRTTCTKWAKQHGVKFTVRADGKDVCIWRVA